MLSCLAWMHGLHKRL